MGSSAAQQLECLVCRQGSEQGHCVNLPGELRGRLCKLGILCCILSLKQGEELGNLTSVLLAQILHREGLKDTEERSQGGRKLDTGCLGHQSSFSLHVLLCKSSKVSPFPSTIIKGLLNRASAHPVQRALCSPH